MLYVVVMLHLHWAGGRQGVGRGGQVIFSVTGAVNSHRAYIACREVVRSAAGADAAAPKAASASRKAIASVYCVCGSR